MITAVIGAAVPGMSSQTSQADRPNPLLVEPKLMLPRVQLRMLRRARLLELLDDVGGAALTVVNAPVGYGKTTLLRLVGVYRAPGGRDLDDARRGRRRPGAVVDAFGDGRRPARSGSRRSGDSVTQRPGCSSGDGHRRADERPGRGRRPGNDRAR